MSGSKGPTAKFAVVRLKQGDDLLTLFQVLIQNGFGEVSFVNDLSETIFPGMNGGKRSVSPHAHGKMDDTDTATTPNKATPTEQTRQDKSKPVQQTSPAPLALRYQSMVPLGANGTRPMAAVVQHNANAVPANLAVLNATVETKMVSRGALPIGGYSTVANGAGAAPTMSNSVTPPYSLADLFTPGTFPSAAPRNPNAPSPALLAVAALAHQRHTMVGPPSAIHRPPSPIGHTQMCPTSRPPAPLPDPQPVLPGQYHRPPIVPPPVLFRHHSPSVSPRSGSNSSSGSSHQGRPVDKTSALPPGCATTHLRQRGQRSTAEDPSLYVSCRLCKNKIMGSRISNLTNHVRRHSNMKQFQCCYCDYTHNEMAKVRLHMLHNHKDKDSQPIDNLSPEMQASWDLLMKECFPDHYNQQQSAQSICTVGTAAVRQQVTGVMTSAGLTSVMTLHSNLQSQPASGPSVVFPMDPPSQPSSFGTSNGTVDTVNINNDRKLEDLSCVVRGEISPGGAGSSQITEQPASKVDRCAECGMLVKSNSKARHIRKCHLQCLLPFVCSMCGYDHAEHSKVKVHICLKHDDNPMAQVITRDLASYAERLVPAYFPVQGEPDQSTINPNGNEQSTPMDTNSSQPAAVASVIVFGKCDSTTVAQQGTNGKYLRCGVCKRTVDKVRMVGHAKGHLKMGNTRVICPICHYQTNNKIRMMRHLQLKHGPNGQENVKLRVYKRVPLTMTCRSGFIKLAIRRCFQPIRKNEKRWKRGEGKNRVSPKSNIHLNSVQSDKVGLEQQPERNGVHFDPANGECKKKMDRSSPGLVRLCPCCGRWIQRDQLSVHLQTHLLPVGTSYRCSMCDYLAPDQMLMRMHFTREHEKKSGQSQATSQTAFMMDYVNRIGHNSTAAAADG